MWFFVHSDTQQNNYLKFEEKKNTKFVSVTLIDWEGCWDFIEFGGPLFCVRESYSIRLFNNSLATRQQKKSELTTFGLYFAVLINFWRILVFVDAASNIMLSVASANKSICLTASKTSSYEEYVGS